MYCHLTVMLPPPPPPHTAAVSGCIAPMGFDMLSSINGDLTGQQHFCRCHLALMNSPPSFKREAEEIGRRPHTTTRGRVVSDLLTEDERGGFHTWSDIMSSGSSHHDCILPNLLISRFIPLCLICAKLEIPILNPLFLGNRRTLLAVVFLQRLVGWPILLPMDRARLAYACILCCQSLC